MTWTRTNVSLSYSSGTVGPQAAQAGILGNTVLQYTQHGAGAVVLDLEVSNDTNVWEVADSITTSGDGDHTYSVLVNSWKWYRMNISTLSATSLAIEISGG
jgi:hypothetical protein